MVKMTEKQLRKRDTKRNLGEELLQAVREMKAGKAVRVHLIRESTPAGRSPRMRRVAHPHKDTPPRPRGR
jgi:hypothetical protein